MSVTVGEHGDELPSWVLTVLVASGQAIAIALIVAIGSVETGNQDFGAYLFAAGFGALLLLHGEYPVAILIAAVLGVFVYYAADYPPIGMAVPVVGAFYVAAERGRIVIAAEVGVILLGVSLFFRIADGEPSTVLAYDVVTNAALIGCAIALAHAVRSRRAQRNQHARLVALERTQQQQRAVRQLEAERLRIARDVHDSIGHALSLVAVQARVAQQALGRDDTTVACALGHVVTATVSSLADLRRTLVMLQSDYELSNHTPLTYKGIEGTAQAARDAGLDVDVQIDVDDATITAQPSSTAFRIVQESVTNILRHACAQKVKIIVRTEDDKLYLCVSDDGGGRRTQTDVEGRGIAGMRERATVLGGTVTAESSTSGFTVIAILPMKEQS